MSLGKEVGLGSGHIVLDEDPVGTQPPTAAPSHFRPMPIVSIVTLCTESFAIGGSNSSVDLSPFSLENGYAYCIFSLHFE